LTGEHSQPGQAKPDPACHWPQTYGRRSMVLGTTPGLLAAEPTQGIAIAPADPSPEVNRLRHAAIAAQANSL
jgi:hypothetical protein